VEGLNRLADGAAYDFTPLLAMMTAHLDRVRHEVNTVQAATGPGWLGPVQTDLAQIQTALDRAVGLAEHLAAFAHRDRSDSADSAFDSAPVPVAVE